GDDYARRRDPDAVPERLHLGGAGREPEIILEGDPSVEDQRIAQYEQIRIENEPEQKDDENASKDPRSRRGRAPSRRSRHAVSLRPGRDGRSPRARRKRSLRPRRQGFG